MGHEEQDVIVRKNTATRLYEALIGEKVVGNLAYETSGGTVSLTHSFVDPEHRHHGVGTALAEFALADLSESGTRPAVHCGFVADFIDSRPEWRDAADVRRSARARRRQRTSGGSASAA